MRLDRHLCTCWAVQQTGELKHWGQLLVLRDLLCCEQGTCFRNDLLVVQEFPYFRVNCGCTQFGVLEWPDAVEYGQEKEVVGKPSL